MGVPVEGASRLHPFRRFHDLQARSFPDLRSRRFRAISHRSFPAAGGRMRSRSFHALAMLVSAGVSLPAAALSQETASDTLLTVAHYLDWEQVLDPQISPD